MSDAVDVTSTTMNLDTVTFTTITDGLRFPEGPVAMPDGSVVLVEMFGRRITRVQPDGGKETVAEIAGGPNGLAAGPDGMLYLCNNGGSFRETDVIGFSVPAPGDPAEHLGGSIQRVDPASGEVTTLYTEFHDGHGTHPLRGPNDLVFDAAGGFYFTDHGVHDRVARTITICGIYYATPDGTSITEVAYPVAEPNGIGLSPDGTRLYWAETQTGRLFARAVAAPGVLAPAGIDAMLCGLPGLQLFDSLAVDGEGHICVATLVNGGITVIAADGAVVAHIPTGDPMTTNICFGDDDHSGEYRDAYLTLSGTGKLVRCRWPWKGLRLNWL